MHGDFMSKDKSFAAKLSKAAGAASAHCPTCGELLSTLHVVDTVKNEEKQSYKFKETYVPVCKCNQNEVMS
jgi:hypothetical protein